jgi:hypothetical protein
LADDIPIAQFSRALKRAARDRNLTLAFGKDEAEILDALEKWDRINAEASISDLGIPQVRMEDILALVKAVKSIRTMAIRSRRAVAPRHRADRNPAYCLALMECSKMRERAHKEAVKEARRVRLRARQNEGFAGVVIVTDEEGQDVARLPTARNALLREHLVVEKSTEGFDVADRRVSGTVEYIDVFGGNGCTGLHLPNNPLSSLALHRRNRRYMLAAGR